MTWDSYEKSVESGHPIELHEFAYGSYYYRNTGADEDYIDGNSIVWSAGPIISAEIEEDQAEGRADMTLEVELNLPALNPFKDGVPYMEYTMYQVHLEDPDQETIILFKGRATDVTYFPNEFKARIVCKSYSSVLDELTMRKKCQVQCPHGIYTADCGVSPLAHKVVAQVTSVQGSVVTVDGPAVEGTTDDFFPGGYIEWVHSSLGVKEERMIAQWDAATKTMVLVSPAPGLDPQGAVSMYPGCDHLLTTCDTKFNNARRYGGVPFKPDGSPFGGKALF